MSELAEPLPCPFCGGNGYMHTEHDTDGCGVFLSIKCRGCRASSGNKFSSEPCPITYSEVRDAWNTRTSKK